MPPCRTLARRAPRRWGDCHCHGGTPCRRGEWFVYNVFVCLLFITDALFITGLLDCHVATLLAMTKRVCKILFIITSVDVGIPYNYQNADSLIKHWIAAPTNRLAMTPLSWGHWFVARSVWRLVRM